MGRVFIPQRPKFKDRVSRQWVDKFNLRPAQEYGDLVEILAYDAKPGDEGVVDRMHDVLYDFCDEDYILCIGNPTLLMWCGAIATMYNGGAVACLEWNTHDENYRVIERELWID